VRLLVVPLGTPQVKSDKGINMASAFAQGFQMGGDMYDSAERMKLMKEQQQWAREEAEAKRAERLREADIRTTGTETFGRVGQPSAFMTAGGAMGPAQPTPQQNAQAENEMYRNMGGRLSPEAEANLGVALPRGDAAKMFPKQEMYSSEQAEKDYLKKLRGIDIGKAQQYEKGTLELSNLKRGERYAQQQENALGFQQNVMSDLAKNGGDVGAILEKHFIPLYNENKLPGLADGGTAKIVPSAVGGGKSILITDKDGKESTLPADMATLQKLTKFAQDNMIASSTPENYWKNKDQYIKEMNATSQQTSAQASVTSAAASTVNAATNAKQLDQQIKAGLFEAQAGQARASANQANAHASVYKNMVDLAKTNKEAGEAVKEALAKYETLTDAEKAGPKGQQVLTEGALAAAKKTGDVTGIMNALKKPDRSTVTAEAEKAAYALYNEAVSTGDPKRIAAAKAAYPQVFGPSELDKAIAAKNKPPTAPAPAAASTETPTAIPTAAAPPAAPVAPATALPTNIPPVTSSTIQGPKKYQIKGVIGVFKTPEEAQAAWAQKYAPKAPAMFN
jgi:hypothetical protein